MVFSLALPAIVIGVLVLIVALYLLTRSK